jgi:hypothetical protein
MALIIVPTIGTVTLVIQFFHRKQTDSGLTAKQEQRKK